jgi:hypothetical protein
MEFVQQFDNNLIPHKCSETYTNASENSKVRPFAGSAVTFIAIGSTV